MPKYEFHPLTSDRWADLELLFGKNGACAGCWCMFFRLKRSVFDKQKGDANKNDLKKLVQAGKIPVGIIGYVDGKASGWVSFGKREEFPRIENSRLFQRVDDNSVWSVVCFFVARGFRRSGLTLRLLLAAIDAAKKNGARIIEGYPIEPKKDQMPDTFAYHGFASVFRKAGFVEVIRRSETRPMMRKTL